MATALDREGATRDSAPTAERVVVPASPLDERPAPRRSTRRRTLVVELGLLAVVVAVAAWVRFDDLTGMPPGLHGDEAITGIEGRRILREGWIGPYSPLALGQPTGPLYLTALSVGAFGDTVLAVRFVPALLGTLTVPLLWLVVRRSFGPAVGLAAAGLLATLGWHIHFARIGFPLEAWPLVVVFAAGALVEAIRRDGVGWWTAAGAAAAVGIYVYNAHPIVLVAWAGVVLFHLYRWEAVLPAVALAAYAVWPNAATLALLAGGALLVLRSARVAAGEPFLRVLAAGGAFVAVALPMARFAADERNGYFQHAKTYSVLERPEWTDLSGPFEKARFTAEGYVEVWNRLCCRPEVDGVDATGVTPVAPLALLVLAGIGLGLALRCRRGPLVAFGALVVALMPFAAVFTVDGAARRVFAMAPFLALFAAVGLVEGIRWAWRQPLALRLVAIASVGGLSAVAVYQSLDNELRRAPDATETSWVFAEEITDASRFMADLPPGRHVYFASERWSVDYETRRFLAPGVAAENRSAEHGTLDFAVDPGRGRPVFVLLGRYLDRLPELERRYPGGTTTVGRTRDGGVSFVAYELPPGADSSASAGPTATSRPGSPSMLTAFVAAT